LQVISFVGCLCDPDVDLLLYWLYVVLNAWNGIQSQYFTVANGSRKGEYLVQYFTCYTDELLVKLSKCGVGCCFGSFFVGALAYAFDLVLLAPTPSAMRHLLAIM